MCSNEPPSGQTRSTSPLINTLCCQIASSRSQIKANQRAEILRMVNSGKTNAAEAARLKVARAKGKVLGRPPLSEETIQKVLLLNRHAGIGARKIAKSTGFPLGTVNAILTRSRQQT